MVANTLSGGSGASSQRVETLRQTLQAIDAMGLEELRAIWTNNFGVAPSLRSTDLMRLSLSWRLQARVYGGLDPALRRQLKRNAKISTVSVTPEPGTILVREYQGQTFEIEILEAGCRMNDQTYRSLSAVASAITGTRWNGPAFFGLRDKQP